jgi:hydrogenase maturation protein HypF
MALSLTERRLLVQMLERGLNAPITTSTGRLFDAVAALVGLHQQATFEGQAAMALEYAADVGVEDAYPLPLIVTNDAGKSANTEASPQPPVVGPSPLVLDWGSLVEAVLEDLQQGVKAGIIAARFHNALVEAILAVAQAVGAPRVALTGGCFQNRLLTERAASRLSQAGFEALLHRQVPPNDGGISLGQVIVAADRLEGEA